MPRRLLRGIGRGLRHVVPGSDRRPLGPRRLLVEGPYWRLVSAVTTTSLSVKGTSESWTFTIDKDTEVTAKGATRKSLALKADGKSSVLTDFVKVGDRVAVSYHETGTTKHAASINVTQPALK